MLNDRENILSALREKAMKVREIMKRANVAARPGFEFGLASDSTGAPAGTTAGGRSHARPVHHVHACTACFANFNDNIARRVLEGCRRNSLGRRCQCKGKGNNDQS
jgi:hypothetical protein